MNPTTWLIASEAPAGSNMRALCIQAMELLTENMYVDELGAEIRRLTPLIQRLVPAEESVIVHEQEQEQEQEQTDEDLRATVHLRVAAEWNELGELAYQASLGEIVPSKKVSRFVRHLYTCWSWPSPLPRLMALELGLSTNKRLKHIQAIHLLANRLGCTFFDFLSKERREVAERLFPTSYWTSNAKKYGVRRILYR